MNNSGSIIPLLLKKQRMDRKNLLVIADNMDLEPGRCKFKIKGSPAAHNGLKSISHFIETDDYMRLYVGIGHPGNRTGVIDHVLGDPDISEVDFYNESYQNAVSAILKISEGLQEQVMNELNRKKTGNKCT